METQLVSNMDSSEFQRGIAQVTPDEFDGTLHYYERTRNAELHPMVRSFLALDIQRIVRRYCHLNPAVHPDGLLQILTNKPKHFRWGGTDLFNVASESGMRQMLVVETNSCPSGNKSMPLRDTELEDGSYGLLARRSFVPAIRTGKGLVAVLYDKNAMEAKGYAQSIANACGENVHLVPWPCPLASWREDVLWLNEQPVRAAFRYVTQKPWTTIPVSAKTRVYNPVIVCLAGGRNKLLASKAYEFFNAEIASLGLKINVPETIRDVRKDEVPLWLEKFGGRAVVKVPYGNAGQGVYTITSDSEYQDFVKRTEESDYDAFVVQQLIGNHQWSSKSSAGKLYHVGTVPDRKNRTYVADLRLTCIFTDKGFRPLSMYARRARLPLSSTVEANNSWDVLGTNLSVKCQAGSWKSDTSRLILMDNRDFNKLGLGIDDLISAYIQTVLAITAIDKMAQRLLSPKRRLRKRLFLSLNPDRKLMSEIESCG